MRIGCGYDVHPLVEQRKLILGGIEIPHSKGLQGHSDADVLLHAVCDALLGAAAAGDIGMHFPDTDSQYKGISSGILLERTNEIIRAKGYQINNIDITIIAQKPKLQKYIPLMKEKILQILRLDFNQLNIKATTTEGLGSIGREEGIASLAVASVFEVND